MNILSKIKQTLFIRDKLRNTFWDKFKDKSIREKFYWFHKIYKNQASATNY